MPFLCLMSVGREAMQEVFKLSVIYEKEQRSHHYYHRCHDHIILNQDRGGY